MDSVRCEKYKVYQPELPSKKFPPDEDVSIHNIKVLRGDSGDQNKSTFFEGDIKKSVPDLEIVEEDKEELARKRPIGVFRDGERRIDIVLVLKDDVNANINKIQLDFIVNILRAGLEVELEPGVLKKHKNLTFVKIHAPQHVLDKYGVYFGTKRNFADTRYDYIAKSVRNKEKQCLKLMRSGLLSGYSNYERGIIVYKILLHLPFSNHEDDYGVERLLNKYIVADIFALHDGQNYLTSEKRVIDVNGKKILYDFWIGNLNIFRQQPIHLIHEYLGPRVAFYFSFYEFFNKALQLAALAGVCDIIYGFNFNLSSLEKPIEKGICESNAKMCQSCPNNVTCPARPVKEYCFSTKIHLILDHMFVPLFSIFLILGAFLFIRIWKRKEHYLKWMWEVGKGDSYYKKTVRPLYFSGLTKTDTSMRKYIGPLVSLFFRNFVSKIITILYWYYTIPVMVNTYKLYDKFCTFLIKKKIYTEKEKYRDYIMLSIFYAFYITFATVCEKVYNYFVNFVVKYENYNTYEKHWESLIIKKIGFRLVMHYLFLAYFAWVYGHYMFYRYRDFTYVYLTSNINDMLKYLYGYEVHDVYNIFSFCFPYSCIIEIGTLLATLILVTQVIYKIIQYIFDFLTICTKSMQSRSEIPFWEEEYMLRSISYEEMDKKYMELANQFAMVLWFVIAFPLAPLVIYVINIFDIRIQARKFLQMSRRPLFIKAPAIGWNKVFYFISLFSVVTNVINLALVTRTATRYVMTKYDKKPSELFDYVNYNKNPWLTCYAPDMRTPFGKDNHEPQTPFMFCIDYLLLLMYRYYFAMLFVSAMICVIFVILYLFPKQRNVEKARGVEQKIRQLYKHYEFKNAK